MFRFRASVCDFVGSAVGVDVDAGVGNFIDDMGGGKAGARRVGNFVGSTVGVDVGVISNSIITFNS